MIAMKVNGDVETLSYLPLAFALPIWASLKRACVIVCSGFESSL